MAYQKGASELKDKIAIIQQLFTDISVMYSSDDPEAARLRQAHLDSVNRITIPTQRQPWLRHKRFTGKRSTRALFQRCGQA